MAAETADSPAPLTAQPAGALTGTVPAPGDKSISHRALLLSALAVGRARVTGLLEGADVHAMAGALSTLGVPVARDGDGAWTVDGVGISGLAEPDTVLDLGNSGTAARLLMGAIAGQPIRAVLTGDASLRTRPMARVADPLTRIGARIESRGGRLPLTITGAESPLPIRYASPVASAQVKSAVLLAGLAAPGRTAVVEPAPTRDHTERLLRQLGATVTAEDEEEGAQAVTVTGQPELEARAIAVPGDPSSAAFPLVAALLVPGSAVTVTGVCMNPLRTGLFDCLRKMGADLEITARPDQAGEPVADITARASDLTAIEVPATRAPSMIDEYPILAVAAACARGTTVMRGLSELRVKESDRLSAVAAGLAANGVAVSVDGDDLSVTGATPSAGGGLVATHHDHRIAMAFLVLGLAARAAVTVDDGRMIATSFPGFTDLMGGLGAAIGPAETAP